MTAIYNSERTISSKAIIFMKFINQKYSFGMCWQTSINRMAEKWYNILIYRMTSNLKSYYGCVCVYNSDNNKHETKIIDVTNIVLINQMINCFLWNVHTIIHHILCVTNFLSSLYPSRSPSSALVEILLLQLIQAHITWHSGGVCVRQCACVKKIYTNTKWTRQSVSCAYIRA